MSGTKILKTRKQKALEAFLNDDVEKVTNSLFKWRGRYYEVLTFNQTVSRHNWSGFIRLEEDVRVREMTKETLKRYYPKVLTNN